MLRTAPADGNRASVSRRWHPLLVVPLALTAWVYHPVLRVNFFADDFVHFAAIESDGTLDFLLAPFGGHNYLVRNLFFLAAWEAFGLHAPAYYALALATHLLNVGLLFGVLRALTGSAAVACFGAALWGASPLCVGSIGWFSVYGQVLVATVLLLVLLPVSRAAAAGGEAPRPGAACAWYGLLLAGTTCFGVGLGVALAFPIVLFLLLPAAWRRPGLRLAWVLLPVVTMALYFGFRRLYPLIAPMSLQEVLQERVAIQTIWASPPLLGHLLAFSVSGTTLGSLAPVTYPSPASWAVLAAFLAGLALVFARGTPLVRRAALSMVALAVMVYLTIAAGRIGAFTAFGIDPPRAARTPRYHYVGGIPIVILLGLVLRELARLPGLAAVPAPLGLAAGLGLLGYGAVRHRVQVQDYHWTPDYVRQTAETIAAAVRARPPGSTVYLENDETPRGILGPALPAFAFPGRAGVFVLLHQGDELDGRTVRFIERSEEVQAFYAKRPHSRLAKLLVSPDAAPARP